MNSIHYDSVDNWIQDHKIASDFKYGYVTTTEF